LRIDFCLWAVLVHEADARALVWVAKILLWSAGRGARKVACYTELPRIHLPRTWVNSLLLELLLSDLYNRHPGDGSRLPLLGWRRTGRHYEA
jgi:hypothetical protein